MKPYRFLAKFETGPDYESPDVQLGNPGWADERFQGGITSLDFSLPTGHRIRMAGFDAYNLFVEASERLSGGGGRIDAIWICGARDGVAEMYRIGNGRVIRKRLPLGREWGGGPTSGWKTGAGGSLFSGVVKA